MQIMSRPGKSSQHLSSATGLSLSTFVTHSVSRRPLAACVNRIVIRELFDLKLIHNRSREEVASSRGEFAARGSGHAGRLPATQNGSPCVPNTRFQSTIGLAFAMPDAAPPVSRRRRGERRPQTRDLREGAAASLSVGRSLVGGWHSRDDLLDWPYPEIRTLRGWIGAAVQEMTRVRAAGDRRRARR